MNASFDMNTSSVNKRRPRGFGQRGFGLLEALLCISLMSLLFLGAMTMLLTAGRGVVRTQSQVYSNGDAANAVQNIIGQLREASTFSLPTSNAPGTPESNWTPVSSTLLGHFSTTMPNGETINTAMEIVTPGTLTSQANGYTAQVVRKDGTTGLPDFLRVRSRNPDPSVYWESGQGTWTAAPATTQINGGLGVPGSNVYLIYRGDPDGTPDADPTGSPIPKAGTYLWQYKVPADSSFNLVKYAANVTVLCKSVATAPNAVQFVRPAYGTTQQNQAYGTVAQPNQIEIKVISSYYSPINGQQTNEETAGATSSQLNGKCVFMRDHFNGSNPQAPSNTGARGSNNVFQYR